MAPLLPPMASLADAKVAPEVKIHEVWKSNLDAELGALLSAVSNETGAILALDMEFPGFVCQEPRAGARALRYQAMRENVDRLQPIQLGAAVASPAGILRGVWSFNLQFDVEKDLHTEKALSFLRAAGLDFDLHKDQGIEAGLLGRRLAASVLIGRHPLAPCWVTFSGSYDLGYLLKLLKSGKPLPSNLASFDEALSNLCPRRHELRDELPYGSLDLLAKRHGLQRHGNAHTAGSDALLTLELFLRVVGISSKMGDWSRWSTWGGGNASLLGGWDFHNGWYQAWDPHWDQACWEAPLWGGGFPLAHGPWLAGSPLFAHQFSRTAPSPSGWMGSSVRQYPQEAVTAAGTGPTATLSSTGGRVTEI